MKFFLYVCLSLLFCLRLAAQGCSLETIYDSLPAYQIDTHRGKPLPSVLSLKNQCPPVGNQADCNSCSAWSLVYYGMTIRDNVRDMPYSPHFICQKAGKCDVGMKLSEALGIAMQQAIPSMSEMSACPQPCCAGVPNPIQEQELESLKGQNAETRLKDALANGFPVLLTINLNTIKQQPTAENNYFWVLGGLKMGESHQQYHAVCVVGYNDTEQWVEIVNSKGSNWGNQGFARISYEHLLLPVEASEKRNVFAFVLR